MEVKIYEIYYDFKDQIKYMKSYRTLAINRGEKEKFIFLFPNNAERKAFT